MEIFNPIKETDLRPVNFPGECWIVIVGSKVQYVQRIQARRWYRAVVYMDNFIFEDEVSPRTALFLELARSALIGQ